MEDDNEGFEDLTAPNTDGSDADSDNGDADSGSDDGEAQDDSNDEDGQSDSDNAPDPAMDTAALEATIAILQAENALQAEEIEKWKNINLQLLLSMPNDATVGTEDEDIDGDDPAPYSSVSGSDSLFEIKGE